MNLEKRLDESFDLLHEDKTRIFAQSSYGVIIEVKQKAGKSNKPLVLKTVQTIDINAPEDNLDKERCQENYEAINREINFLSTLATDLNLSSNAEVNIINLVDFGLWPYNTHHQYTDKESIPEFKNGFPAFLMPKGINLKSYVENCITKNNTDYPVSSLDFLRWSLHAATAISAVHKHEHGKQTGKKVHRDIKPANFVLIDKTLFLIDFGLIKERTNDATISMMGTPFWMAPESALPTSQNQDNEYQANYGAPSDLYCLGLVMFWMATRCKREYEYLESQREIGKLFHNSHEAQDKFGHVGGMNENERKRLMIRLNELFRVTESPTGTFIRKERNNDPVAGDVVEGVCSLIDRLFAIQPVDRPKASEVIEDIKKLIGVFIATSKPTIKAPNEVALKEPVAVRVQLDADWLPSGLGLVDVTMNNIPAREIEEKQPGLWSATMAESESQGEFEVRAGISLEGVRVEATPTTVRVVASADQLWDMGKYGDALIKDPDRGEWWKFIRDQTNNDGEKCCQWQKMLRMTYEEIEANGSLRAHTKFRKGYFRLVDECEAYKNRNKTLIEPPTLAPVGLETTQPADFLKRKLLSTAIAILILFVVVACFAKIINWENLYLKGQEWFALKKIVVKENASPYETKQKKVQVPAYSPVEMPNMFFTLLVASFGDKKKAERDMLGWKAKGQDAFYVPPEEGTDAYRVFIGKFEKLAEANDVAAKLESEEDVRAYVTLLSEKTEKVQVQVPAYSPVEMPKNIEMYRFIIKASPADAKISLFNGLEEINYVPNGYLKPGEYNLRIVAPGYDSKKINFDITNKDIKTSAELDTIIDPKRLINLTPKAATSLAQFQGNELILNGLKNISPEAAKNLALYKGEILSLDGLESVNPEVAKNLALYKGNRSVNNDTEKPSAVFDDGDAKLSLNGLKRINPDAAINLAQFKGTRLSLNGLKDISPETAINLALYKGNRFSENDLEKPSWVIEQTMAELSLNGLERISPETAINLAQFEGSTLSLDGLKDISPETAINLAQMEGSTLLLDGLKDISPETAINLAQMKGCCLSFDGLKDISPETAINLAQSDVRYLSLNGLKDISPDVAKNLCQFHGFQLYLNGLKNISPEAAKNLAKSEVVLLNLDGLESISPEVAKNLCQFKGNKLSFMENYLSLEGLKRIDPDVQDILCKGSYNLNSPKIHCEQVANK
ncbi:MAG: protein kinase [Desulfobulbaceae bacterium]|nr:protein kinase [Desulfobulbaceae bacterium]